VAAEEPLGRVWEGMAVPLPIKRPLRARAPWRPTPGDLHSGAKFAKIFSAGHLPSIEVPDELDRALLQFLTELGQTTP
jgi:pimeloyl-ACP methyl ester carboxylesterase